MIWQFIFRLIFQCYKRNSCRLLTEYIASVYIIHIWPISGSIFLDPEPIYPYLKINYVWMVQGWFFDHRADVPNKMLCDKDGLISEHIFNLANLKINNKVNHPFVLHPEKWFEGYVCCKIYPDFNRVGWLGLFIRST